MGGGMGPGTVATSGHLQQDLELGQGQAVVGGGKGQERIFLVGKKHWATLCLEQTMKSAELKEAIRSFSGGMLQWH